MKNKDGVPFDGFGQVIEMLQKADPAFREKIIRNIAARDPALAQRLLNASARANRAPIEDQYERSQELLAQRQRTLNVRSYGR
jgi:hypothetical protein